jgi:hypothetical protein
MMLEFTVGINIAGKHESVTVAAEDALIAVSTGATAPRSTTIRSIGRCRATNPSRDAIAG